ncbi:hypothetical protein Emag_004663 [Eimeria magna]
MQPAFSGAPASSSTGPAFWSYSYAKENLPQAAEAAGSNVVLEPVDTEHLNRLVAASMYASIKQSLPYILQTQYNYTPESGPWYPHQQAAAAETSAEPGRVASVSFQDTAASCDSSTAPKRQRPTRGCC